MGSSESCQWCRGSSQDGGAGSCQAMWGFGDKPNPVIPYDRLLDYSLDPFEFQQDQLATLFYQMIHQIGLRDHFMLSSGTIVNFARQVLQRYKAPPYHNCYHGFGVTQFLFTSFAKSNKIRSLLTMSDALALLVGALAHDVDHPGNNNALEVAIKSPLALKYNDLSVLENHHVAIGLEIMQGSDRNVFGTVGDELFDQLKKTYTYVILQTDMAQHFKMVEDLKGMTEENARPFDGEVASSRRTLAGVLLHSADISNPLVPNFDLCRKWAERITQEFVNQYRKELELSLPPTQMWATVDKPLGFYKSQGGFIGFVVAPLWNIVLDIFPDVHDDTQLARSMQSNKAEWARLAEQEEANAQPAKP